MPVHASQIGNCRASCLYFQAFVLENPRPRERSSIPVRVMALKPVGKVLARERVLNPEGCARFPPDCARVRRIPKSLSDILPNQSVATPLARSDFCTSLGRMPLPSFALSTHAAPSSSSRPRTPEASSRQPQAQLHTSRNGSKHGNQTESPCAFDADTAGGRNAKSLVRCGPGIRRCLPEYVIGTKSSPRTPCKTIQETGQDHDSRGSVLTLPTAAIIGRSLAIGVGLAWL